MLCAAAQQLLLTNLDGSNPQPAVLQQHAYAARRDSLSQPTDHTTRDQHILHIVALFRALLLLPFRAPAMSAGLQKNEAGGNHSKTVDRTSLLALAPGHRFFNMPLHSNLNENSLHHGATAAMDAA